MTPTEFYFTDTVIETRKTILMSGHTSRVGQRAERFSISDHPHTSYFQSGCPILQESGCGWGTIIAKHIEFVSLRCPQCEEIGHYDENSQPFCEDCGFVLRDLGVPRTDDGDRIVSDSKSAGRVEP